MKKKKNATQIKKRREVLFIPSDGKRAIDIIRKHARKHRPSGGGKKFGRSSGGH